MKKLIFLKYCLVILIVVCVCAIQVQRTYADTSTSTNYRLDAAVNNSFGGQISSTNYQLLDSGGESIIGSGASGSYVLAQGYSAQILKSIQLTTPATLGLGAVNAGTSNTASTSLSVLTDAPGYTLSIQQNHDLQTATSSTIPPISGTISSPLTWSESSTKGLGFTLTTTNATAIPAKWSSGNAYAAVPSSATGFYTRAGYSGGTTDTLGVRFRLDVPTIQSTGLYSHTITWTATTTP